MIETVLYFGQWARYLARRLWFTLWPAARIRAVNRRLRQLVKAAHDTPSKHDDPEYQARFLQSVFDGTYQSGDVGVSGAASPAQDNHGPDLR